MWNPEKEGISIMFPALAVFHYLLSLCLQLQKEAKERNQKQRNAFIARMAARYTSNQLVFLDESAKDEQTSTHQYGYLMVNKRAGKSIVLFMDGNTQSYLQ